MAVRGPAGMVVLSPPTAMWSIASMLVAGGVAGPDVAAGSGLSELHECVRSRRWMGDGRGIAADSSWDFVW